MRAILEREDDTSLKAFRLVVDAETSAYAPIIWAE